MSIPFCELPVYFPNPNPNVRRINTGFPTKLAITHKYSELVYLTGTTGAAAAYLFSCNGMYDPNITGTGHQPLYFDQCTPIYDHYTVMRSRVRIQVLGSPNYLCSLFISDDTGVPSGIILGGEFPSNAKPRLSPPNTVHPLVLTRNWDAKFYFGGDIFDNDDLQGSSAANPVEQSYYQFMCRAADGSSTLNITLQVDIEYDAIWDELKTIATS